MKQVYREIYKEELNGKIIHYESGQLKYEVIGKKDNYIISFNQTDDFNYFKSLVKTGEVKSSSFGVVQRFGKDVLKEYSWWESWTYNKKCFKKFVAKKYICYCNNYSIKELKSSLPAAQYIDWCKDHGVADDDIKLEL